MISITDLPTLNAVLNTISGLLLLAGYVLIRSGARKGHQYCMTSALISSILFLVSYTIYHYHIGSKPFDGEGLVRYLYFAILISHAILAAALVPLVPITVVRAWKKDFARHKSLAVKVFPVWVYVSITGVLVYLMLYGF